MQYEVVHGIARNDGAAITVHGCPCEHCDNVIMQAKDADGASVRLDLSRCEFGHLLGELLALADGMNGTGGDCPQPAAAPSE